MMWLPGLLDQSVPLLWRATWQAALLVALVFVARAMLGRRLAPAWRFALWGVVLARLLIPVLPAGPLSVFRLMTSLDALREAAFDRPVSWDSSVVPPRGDVTQYPTSDDRFTHARRFVASTRPAPHREDARPLMEAVIPTRIVWTPMRIAGLIWLVGVCFLTVRTASAAERLRRLSRSCSIVDDPSDLALFESCRRTMGVRRPVRLHVTAEEIGPAVTGLWKSCVLVPRFVFGSATRDDLEHILLHELAHVRRWDVAVNWLLIAAGIIHWFNPLVWFTVARMRDDRELACDAAVLKRLDRPRRLAYGKTLLKLAARLVSAPAQPALVGVFGTGQQLQERIVMIARFTPSQRGGSRLAAGLMLALVVVGLTDSVGAISAGGSSVGSILELQREVDATRRADEPIPTRIAQPIAVLRETKIEDFTRWAKAVRELVEIGKPAVPALIEELDRTTEDRPIRSLGFTLRAIGDPRAVPALIRAIPRTLVPAGSDYGLRMRDPELLTFLKKHDLDKREGGELFTFGMPYREITGALHSLTGQRFNEEELNFINLEGTPKQRWLQLWLFHQLAGRWTIWWKKEWRRFTDDPVYAKVSLPSLPEAPKVVGGTAEQPFPTGNAARVSSGWANVIVGPPQPQEYYRTFKDLDTGREIKWPVELPEPSKVKGEAVAAFASREGFDLRGIEYTPPGSDKSYYALQGLGLRAWQVANDRYDSIDGELHNDKPFELGRPAGDLLMDFDPTTQTYNPENEATFLFVTREGTTGILQVTSLVTELFGPDDLGRPLAAGGKSNRGLYRGVQIRYKFIYEGDGTP